MNHPAVSGWGIHAVSKFSFAASGGEFNPKGLKTVSIPYSMFDVESSMFDVHLLENNT